MPVCYRLQSYKFTDGRRLAFELTNANVGAHFCSLLETSFPGLIANPDEPVIHLDTLAVELPVAVSGRLPSGSRLKDLFGLLETLITVYDPCDVSHCLDMYRLPREEEDSPEEWIYTEVGERLFRAKYRGSVADRNALCSLLAEAIKGHAALTRATLLAAMPPASDHGSRPDCPSYWVRQMASSLGLPVVTVSRSRPTPMQKGFSDPEARARNQAGSMSVDQDLRGQSVLVIDDLYTMGDSVKEAHRALKASGCEGVFSLCAVKTAKGCQGYPF